MFLRTSILTLLLLALITTAASSAYRLPDTDQTKCYDTGTSGAEILCEGTGQDGAYTINPMSYIDNGDGTVTDINTGLILQKCTAGQNNDSTCSGTAENYNWYRASGTFHASFNPESQSVCGALSLGGHVDWRLPSKKELVSTVDYSILFPSPAIKGAFFPNTVASGYWSSTTNANSPLTAWYVAFSRGLVSFENKFFGSYNVRCVRGGQ